MVILNVTLKLYNTLTRKKELFKPLKKGKVKMYACGPTVYDYPHIGNYRAYIFEDLLRRYLEYSGYEVKFVMNITDVDDKTIAASGGKRDELNRFTEKYESEFRNGLDILKIEPADVYPKATETIDEMVALINRLLEKGIAYRSDDGSIYFSIDKYPDYGKLVHLNPEDMRSGERVSDDEYEKEGARDFVLWKAWKESDGDIHWDEGLGKGRPGWHIECSAMSMKHLGKQLDIHCGGVDNIFPHHENEIAQSEAATGEKFVGFWVHCAHLILDGEKMSKSLGNVKLLEELLEEDYSPEAIRLALLSTHYRSQLDLTEAKLKEAEGNIQKFRGFFHRMKSVKVKGKLVGMFAAGKALDFHSDFIKALDDDLNISEALSALFQTMRKANKLFDNGEIGKDESEQFVLELDHMDEVLGILPKGEEKIDRSIYDKIVEREKARESKDWDLSDKIRDEIYELGYVLEDSSEGTIPNRRR